MDSNQPEMLKKLLAHKGSESSASSSGKYNRECKGVIIDVYDVLVAFNVTNPALQHLVKKALCAGLRGHKDKAQDMAEILESAQRAVELEGEETFTIDVTKQPAYLKKWQL